MKPFSRMWETDYKHDRRAHRHRCRRCNRIINDGERALMMRVLGKRKTWAVHAPECADARHSPSYTWREVMAVWSTPAHELSSQAAKPSGHLLAKAVRSSQQDSCSGEHLTEARTKLSGPSGGDGTPTPIPNQDAVTP